MTRWDKLTSTLVHFNTLLSESARTGIRWKWCTVRDACDYQSRETHHEGKERTKVDFKYDSQIKSARKDHFNSGNWFMALLLHVRTTLAMPLWQQGLIYREKADDSPQRFQNSQSTRSSHSGGRSVDRNMRQVQK